MPGGPEWIIILLVVLVLFGASRLPKLAHSIGQASKEFKRGQAEEPIDSEGAPAKSEPAALEPKDTTKPGTS